MDVFEAIRNRRSIRAFRPDPIPKDALERLVEALIWAPSAGNLQSRRFFFVYSQELRRKLVSAALNQRFIAEAPLAVVCTADARIARHYGHRGMELYAPQDVAAAIQNFMLAAHALGLGTCWVGAFDEHAVSRVLDLPSHLRPVAIVPVGVPAEAPSPPTHLPVSEIVREIR